MQSYMSGYIVFTFVMLSIHLFLRLPLFHMSLSSSSCCLALAWDCLLAAGAGWRPMPAERALCAVLQARACAYVEKIEECSRYAGAMPASSACRRAEIWYEQEECTALPRPERRAVPVYVRLRAVQRGVRQVRRRQAPRFRYLLQLPSGLLIM